LKKITFDKKTKEITTPYYTIKKMKKGFLIEDSTGDKDIFTQKEIVFFIDLWEQAHKQKINTFYL